MMIVPLLQAVNEVRCASETGQVHPMILLESWCYHSVSFSVTPSWVCKRKEIVVAKTNE
jgi:hypothetical protein